MEAPHFRNIGSLQFGRMGEVRKKLYFSSSQKYGVPPSLRMEGSNLSEKLKAPDFPNSNLLGLQSVRISIKRSILMHFYYIESTKMLFLTQIYQENSNIQSKAYLKGCFVRNMVRFSQFCPFLFYFSCSSAFLLTNR